MRLETLKRRSQFQRVRGGGRFSTSAFVLEGKARPPVVSENGDAGSAGAARQVRTPGGPRIGYTVTKKLGGAVIRNRIRRRLRAAIAAVAPTAADPMFDYVVVARDDALAMPFEALKADLATAFGRVARGNSRKPPRAR